LDFILTWFQLVIHDPRESVVVCMVRQTTLCWGATLWFTVPL